MKNHHDVTLLKRVERDGTMWTGKWGKENQSISVGTLKAGFNRGYTLLLNALEARAPEASKLCYQLEATFLIPCNMNLYLTPSGSQGFDAHYDWMESIVLQLDGSKDWRLWRAVHEPLPTHALKRKPTLSELAALPEPVTVHLRAGDALYLPRGVVHEAQTPVDSEQSLHSTIGLVVLRERHTWEALLHAVVDCEGPTVDALREAEAAEAAEVAEAAEAADPASPLPPLPLPQEDLDDDAKAVLHAALSVVASRADGAPLRRTLPLHSARLLRKNTDALADKMVNGPLAALAEPLQTASSALGTACDASTAGGPATERPPFALEPQRCAAGAPSPAIPRWKHLLARRLVQPRCLAAAMWRVEIDARALLHQNHVARARHLRWHDGQAF